MAYGNAIGLLRRIAKAVRIISLFSNWTDVYSSILLNSELRQLKLRNGITILAPENLQLWNHYNDIWEYKVYVEDQDLNKTDVVIDVGANIGLFTLFASKHASRVYSFEPCPEYFRFLQENITNNQIENVHCYNEALAGRSGNRNLFRLPGSKTGDSLFASTAPTSTNPLRVRCSTLAEVIERNGISRVDFLKLDCEGSEYEILFGTRPEYLSRIEALAMEFHDHLTEYTHRDIVRYLKANGFSVEITRVAGCFGILRARRETSTA